MAPLHPAIEPYDRGMLDVGDGQRVYWEVCGNPEGKPALVLHGGPGSGCTAWHRRLFDPAAYRTVLFDQRGCGRSTPHAAEPDIDLTANTTPHLLADIELLRGHLSIDRWLLLGGSWGSTLALIYAERHPDSASELVLWGVTTSSSREVDWLFRGGLAPLFPEQWHRLESALPPGARARDGDIVEAYSRLLHDPDPAVREHAAFEWCMWESATPDWPPATGLAARFTDPVFALAFARLVTHYIRHDLWLEDGIVLREAHRLASIPGVLINGRFDLQAPLAGAWELSRAWPGSELIVVEDAGHAGNTEGIARELVRATDRFATR
jgi:proline iminopeptidase